MEYLISNERAATTETFTNKKAAYKAMTALAKQGSHFTARVHEEGRCKLTGIDAIRFIKK